MAEGYYGGIITFWRKCIGLVTPVAISRYTLHLVISSDTTDTWVISVIYNSN